MKLLFTDGILEATLFPNEWVYCYWVQHEHGRLQKSLIRDLGMIEKTIFKTKLKGWFTDSNLIHKDFHKLLIRFGAMPREVIGEYQRFIKPIHKEGDLHVRNSR